MTFIIPTTSGATYVVTADGTEVTVPRNGEIIESETFATAATAAAAAVTSAMDWSELVA